MEGRDSLGLDSMTISFLIIESIEMPNDIIEMESRNSFSGLSMKITKESFKVDTSAFLDLLKQHFKTLTFDKDVLGGLAIYNEYYGSLKRIFADFASRDVNKVVAAKKEIDKLITSTPETTKIELKDADFDGLEISKDDNRLKIPIKGFFKNEAILYISTNLNPDNFKIKGMKNRIMYKANKSSFDVRFGEIKSAGFTVKKFMDEELINLLAEITEDSKGITQDDDIIMMMSYRVGFSLFNRLYTFYGPRKIYTRLWFVSTVLFGSLILVLVAALVLKV
eukprot:GAHX01002264.1.p1 GENE.GAHX01002264.1~~GAHX01002264.1.p1  ORF type:complete len:279 (-),score=59.80 GAHX01002264.1:36-872(-)